jgi:hypothetical protein
MKHIELYETFNLSSVGTGRLIIVEGTAPYRLEIQALIDRMEQAGELAIVDMSACDEEEIEEAVASEVDKVLFINGDDCDRAIRYAVMDLHPEIIPSNMITPEDLKIEIE